MNHWTTSRLERGGISPEVDRMETEWRAAVLRHRRFGHHRLPRRLLVLRRIHAADGHGSPARDVHEALALVHMEELRVGHWSSSKEKLAKPQRSTFSKIG
jgi:hypothetical protein